MRMFSGSSFEGRRAVVTGGARGIGRAVTDALVALGATVSVLDLEPATGLPSGATFLEVDVTNRASVDAACGRIPDDATLLVNNAGITRDRMLHRMTDDEWQAVLDTNLTGAFHLLRALAPRMREARHGRIVNVTSINGLRGKLGQANYAAAKAGLIGLTKSAARELGPYGVTVNAVAPGMVLTELARNLPTDVLDRAHAEAVLGVLAEPEDVARAVVFLLSEAARRITGEVLRVDAGQYI